MTAATLPTRAYGTTRSTRKLQSAGLLLVVAVIVGSLATLHFLRIKDTSDWQRNLRGTSFLLAQHTAQMVSGAQLVLQSVSEQVERAQIRNAAEFRQRLSGEDTYQLLRDKVQLLPQLDVISLVASSGDNINFSRSHPVPGINLAERDYFKAHLDDPQLGDHLSAAVRNKGNGQWTFYLSRRINSAKGEFLGLVLVGLSVNAITGIYDQVVQDLGQGSGITLLRTDLTALARSPRQDGLIGQHIPADGPVATLLRLADPGGGVELADTPRFSTGTRQLRLVALNRVDRYPLAVAVIVPDEIFLANWYRACAWVGGTALAFVLVIAASVTGLTRAMDRRAQVEQELRESETKFHTMLDWATDWEYWLREDGSVHYMTPSVTAFTGYSVADFVANPGLFDRVVHPEDQAIWQAHQAQIEPPSPNDVHPLLDLRLLHRDGSLRWVSRISRPVYGPAGQYLGRRITLRDITERKASEEEIRQLAFYDVLTGLPNRRLLHDRLNQARVSADRSGSHGALALIDLDHFKRLNDTRGHDIGDRLLTAVAQRLGRSLRESDTVARLGGDEFAVLITGLDLNPETAARQAATAVGHLHQDLGQPYALGDGTDHPITPSVGVTLFRGSQVSLDLLMKQADVALYQAKDAGRDTVRFFNPAMQAAIDSRMALESALRKALQQGQFRLYYQPQTDDHDRLIGAEALLRWAHPQHGLSAPGSFIPVAEDCGLILEIGQWVLDTACAQLQRWQSAPATRHLRIAVNVSARQFHQPDFVAKVIHSLRHSGADPCGLTLELTETTLVENLEQVVQRMHELNTLGLRFALDDFGTGYSSLSYLRRLPLDEIKVDRSFVSDIASNSNAAAIVQAVLAMGQSLNMQVIAEGVETQAQRDFLRRHGCWGYQGYLLGHPRPIEDWNWPALSTLAPEATWEI